MGKAKCPPCPNGCKTESGNRRLKMHRLYAKSHGSWKTVGWYCPKCGCIIKNLDDLQSA